MIETNILPMGKQQARGVATRKVTRQLVATEAQLDLAGIELLKLGITLLEARAETGLSATFADRSVDGAVEAIRQWGETRSRTIRNHKSLLVVAGKLGTQEIAYGDGGDRPSDDLVAPMGEMKTAAA